MSRFALGGATRLAAVGLPLMIAAGCRSDAPCPTSIGRAQSAHLTAPTTVDIGGARVTGQPFLNRDFMPTTPSTGSCLLAAVTLRSPDGGALPADLRVSWIHVIHDGWEWYASGVREEWDVPGDTVMVVSADGGPRWGPGDMATIVCGLQRSSGDPVALAMPPIAIGRSE